MKFYNFLIILTFLLILVVTSLGCISKGPERIIQRQNKSNKIDPEILIQRFILDDCKNALSKDQKTMHQLFTNMIVTQANFEASQNIRKKARFIFNKRNFKDCFYYVAEYRSLKALCPNFELHYKIKESLDNFNSRKYKECIENKNRSRVIIITFPIPKVLQDDIKTINENL